MMLSEHFSFEEMVRSQTATRYGINNTPPDRAVVNITMLCMVVLEKVQIKLNEPVFISSGFRCKILNARVGGSKNSQHMAGTTNGKDEAAADIHVKSLTVEQLYLYLKGSGIPFDQLIQEFGAWVHISWSNTPRGECLRAIKERAPETNKLKTVYIPDGKAV